MGLRPNFDEISFQLALFHESEQTENSIYDTLPSLEHFEPMVQTCCPFFGGRLNLETNTMTIGKDYKPKAMHKQNPKRPFKNKKQGLISTVQSNTQKKYI